MIAFSPIASLFIYCYFAKLATESFLKMTDCLYECNWFELPTKLEKYFPFMIQSAQKPIYYHGFGIIILNLETFTKVSQDFEYFFSIFIHFQSFSLSRPRSLIT